MPHPAPDGQCLDGDDLRQSGCSVQMIKCTRSVLIMASDGFENYELVSPRDAEKGAGIQRRGSARRHTLSRRGERA